MFDEDGLPDRFRNLRLFSRRFDDQVLNRDMLRACGENVSGASRRDSGSFNLFCQYLLKDDIMSPIGAEERQNTSAFVASRVLCSVSKSFRPRPKVSSDRKEEGVRRRRLASFLKVFFKRRLILS